MALFAFLLFVPPSGAGTLQTALFLFLTLELFYLCSTFTTAPYDALLPEIARSAEERIRVAGFRVYFGVAGAAVGLVGSGLLVSAFGFPAMAATMALLALVSRYIGLFGIWSAARRSTATTSVPLREALQLTVQNRVFMRFLASFVLFQAALAMLIGLLPFYVSGILNEDAEGVWVSVLTAVGIGAVALSIPLCSHVAGRMSPVRGYRAAMIASAISFPVLLVPGLVPGVPRTIEALVALAIVGAPLAGVFLFPGPITAELCDADAARTGSRREGIFFGMQAFMEKLAVAIAPLMLGLVLLLGNTADRPLGIRLAGPLAGLIVAAGYVIVRNVDDVEERAGEPALAQ
jgi:GPH family glycoside/pentoside/hexuronide:cation symporter